MKINLQKHNKGFTLVELLITIAIIAVLAVVGVVIFTSVGSSARDVKKKGDVKAIAKAYEARYLDNGSYRPLQNTDFASGEIPVPLDGGTYHGLINSDSPSFRVCAALESSSAPTCDTTSDTCYCIESQMGKYASGGAGGGGGGGGGSSYEEAKFAGSAAESTCSSPNNQNQHWTNLANVTSADNGSFTSHQVVYFSGAQSSNIGHISFCLDATNFGFNIPPSATITGLKVEVMKKRQFAGSYTVYDDIVSVIKGGVAGADNKAKAGNWPSVFTYDDYGSQVSLWGEAWTPTDINASNFGMRLRVKTDALQGAMNVANVDAIKTTVYYNN